MILICNAGPVIAVAKIGWRSFRKNPASHSIRSSDSPPVAGRRTPHKAPARGSRNPLSSPVPVARF